MSSKPKIDHLAQRAVLWLKVRIKSNQILQKLEYRGYQCEFILNNAPVSFGHWINPHQTDWAGHGLRPGDSLDVAGVKWSDHSNIFHTVRGKYFSSGTLPLPASLVNIPLTDIEMVWDWWNEHSETGLLTLSIPSWIPLLPLYRLSCILQACIVLYTVQH